MIVSHDHRFIFLKTNKTAGTSIEIALSRFCGAADIITPISPADEQLRQKMGYRGPQNYRARLRDYRMRDLGRLLLKGKQKLRFYNHMGASEARSCLGEPVWNSYFKFCFERNPWDRVISLYYFFYRSGPRPTIAEFIESGELMRLKRRGYEVYTINGQIAVDQVYRYEHLETELESIRIRLGLPDNLNLPRAKSGFRKDRRKYYEILNENQRDRIATMFEDEIRLFGYKFQGS